MIDRQTRQRLLEVLRPFAVIENPLRVDLSEGPKTGTFCEQPGVCQHPRRLLGQVNGDADLDPTKPQPDQQEDDGQRHRSLLCLAGRGQSSAGEHTLEPPFFSSKPRALPLERMLSLARNLLRHCTGLRVANAQPAIASVSGRS